ncbi:ankyrin repeat [Fusarium sporotrichioides]|uniref:Ankyrin repeat n=1 Tax=Fusarium sporotrichioides TaxID=5514 RepID=A0A395SH85_FUSSP|nr:ankyrin repeat [Fusarium sporotrichioides]
MTEIHDAARRGDKSALSELLQGPGFDKINARDEKGCTPLWIASREGHTAFVQSLLSHPKFDISMVNTTCESKHTPLHIAVCFGLDEIVQTLLAQSGIELNTGGINGHTPLTLAVKKGFESTVNLLLAMDEVDLGPDGRRKTPLTTAFESGQLTIASALVSAERRRSPTKTHQTLLSWASANDKRDVVRRINDLYTVNPNLQDGDGDTPLSKAAERGNLSMVRLLLENSAVDVNSKNRDGSTPMSRAALHQHKNVVQLLAAKDNLTLHSLVRAGNLQLTEYLLGCDIDLNHKDPYGMTALHIAIITRKLQITKSLLLRGADINVKDVTGRTPLILAVQHTLRDYVEVLLSRSACMISIQIGDRQRIYDCYSTDSVLRISERTGGLTQVEFVDIECALQNQPDTVRSLIQVDSFSAWRMYSKLALAEPGGLVAVAITVWVPYTRMFMKISGWDECGIAWTIGGIGEDGGLSQKTRHHFSMLPDGWIPESGVRFFEQLIVYLTTKWSELCDGAEDHLSERRMKQLQEKGRSEMIDDLAGDAKNLAELRRCLRSQVYDAKIFIKDYERSQGADLDQQVLKAIERFAKIDVMLQELDQTIKYLLQLEFAWVSIHEAHKSTSLGASMKRLSWITFIFLPAMFASSLFGMNVNILESNPDWRWYLIFIETQIEKHFNQWKMELNKKRRDLKNRRTSIPPV